MSPITYPHLYRSVISNTDNCRCRQCWEYWSPLTNERHVRYRQQETWGDHETDEVLPRDDLCMPLLVNVMKMKCWTCSVRCSITMANKRRRKRYQITVTSLVGRWRHNGGPDVPSVELDQRKTGLIGIGQLSAGVSDYVRLQMAKISRFRSDFVVQKVPNRRESSIIMKMSSILLKFCS